MVWGAAMMGRMSSPAGYAELQRSEFSRLFGQAVNLRLRFAPLLAALALGLAAWEGVGWRWLVLGLVPLVLVPLSVVELARFRREGMSHHAIELNLLVAIVSQLWVSFATGGLESPVMPLLLLATLVWSVMVTGRPWYDSAALGVQLLAPWLFAALAIGERLPDFNLRLLGGGARAGHSDVSLLTFAFFLNLATFAARQFGHALRGVFDAILLRALSAGDELRREQEERARSLVALTGQLAHELKNPLASVKGLATLLSQNVDVEKGAERLAVLRQEVGRMQGVLDEFLTLSRPLLPLSVEPAELHVLCRQVAALHEGLAREKNVSVQVEGEAQVRCDARKVRQILVNLLQNAFDASPRGALVTLRCEAGPGGATLRVLDRGAGLAPEVQPRLFQPGVTNKPHGNGIGLTVARSLARQHGGELELLPRDGGGCEGRLTLPAAPPEEPVS